MSNDVIVGLGSNINPINNINKAVQIITERFSDIQTSRLIKTAPIGFKDQDHFYNGAVRFKTDLSATALKKILLKLEDQLGRIRTENKNGPRTIDLDILVWNGEIIDPDVKERHFLQASIQELAPEFSKKF